MSIRCYSIINWGRIEVANHVAEVFIGEMEVGEFAVNAIQDGVDEVVDGIVMGKCLVRCMMWFGWNIGFGMLNLGGVGSKEMMEAYCLMAINTLMDKLEKLNLNLDSMMSEVQATNPIVGNVLANVAKAMGLDSAAKVMGMPKRDEDDKDNGEVVKDLLMDG